MTGRTLTDEDLEALAAIVSGTPRQPEPYLTTRQVAEMLRLDEDWVREHAAELGGARTGTAKGPLRFRESLVHRAMERRRLQAQEPKKRARPGPKPVRSPGGVELLPRPTQRRAA